MSSGQAVPFRSGGQEVGGEYLCAGVRNVCGVVGVGAPGCSGVLGVPWFQRPPRPHLQKGGGGRGGRRTGAKASVCAPPRRGVRAVNGRCAINRSTFQQAIDRLAKKGEGRATGEGLGGGGSSSGKQGREVWGRGSKKAPSLSRPLGDEIIQESLA